MPKLIISLPDGSERTVELTGQTFTIGRVDDNDIHIDDASVSSRHAELANDGDDYRLKDLDSTNGTRVNGERVSEEKLRDGDQIRFGQISAQYASETVQAEARPLPAVESAAITPASTSARPADFANVSPFATKKKKTDPTGKIVMAFAIVSILAFIFSVVTVLGIQPPTL